MKISDIMKNVNTEERERRMEAINRMNILWNKKQKCDDAAKVKRIESRIKEIARQEKFWLKEIAWFIY